MKKSPDKNSDLDTARSLWANFMRNFCSMWSEVFKRHGATESRKESTSQNTADSRVVRGSWLFLIRKQLTKNGGGDGRGGALGTAQLQSGTFTF